MTNQLAGFTWEQAENLHQLSDDQRWCVREALSRLMGWSANSLELRSIPPGPPATDLRRLCEEKPQLRLIFHGLGDPDLAGDQPGILIGTLATPHGVEGHAEYALKIGAIADKFLYVMGVITRGSG
jgi:hypothetical protein